MKVYVIVCSTLLALIGLQKIGQTHYWHNLIYGNPHKREWTCMGKCPAAVLRIEATEDAQHAQENTD